MHIENRTFTGATDLQRALHDLGYISLAHAVLHRSVFTPPSIVAEVGTGAVFNAVRRGSFDGLNRVERSGYIAPKDAERLFGIHTTDSLSPGVYVDDNWCANFAFMACFDVRRHRQSTQLCHIFPRQYSQNPHFFTALPNLVLVPTWLAKLTDGKGPVPRILRWAARLVYNFCPEHDGTPQHECVLCKRPPESPSDDEVQNWVRSHEHLRTKDFRKAAFKCKDQRWKNAFEAGRGYSHVLLKP